MPRFRELIYPALSRTIRRLKGPVAEAFHILYYDSDATTWKNTYWMGHSVRKNPMDLWIYQEIIFERRPDVLVECGTFQGGSALYFANLFDLLGSGRVITMDIEDWPGKPAHPRIEYITGSSILDDTVKLVGERLAPGEKVMVSLDSNHAKAHVLSELQIYSRFVTRGQYLVVEDTNVDGHPVFPGHGPGPMEAVEAFVQINPDFEVDRGREKFLLTFHPKGFLYRRA